MTPKRTLNLWLSAADLLFRNQHPHLLTLQVKTGNNPSSDVFTFSSKMRMNSSVWLLALLKSQKLT